MLSFSRGIKFHHRNMQKASNSRTYSRYRNHFWLEIGNWSQFFLAIIQSNNACLIVSINRPQIIHFAIPICHFAIISPVAKMPLVALQKNVEFSVIINKGIYYHSLCQKTFYCVESEVDGIFSVTILHGSPDFNEYTHVGENLQTNLSILSNGLSEIFKTTSCSFGNSHICSKSIRHDLVAFVN